MRIEEIRNGSGPRETEGTAEAAKREHELELARLAATNGDGRNSERDDRAKAPKLPAFIDG